MLRGVAEMAATTSEEPEYEIGECDNCGAVGYPCGQFRIHDPDGDWVTKRMLTETWTGSENGHQLLCTANAGTVERPSISSTETTNTWHRAPNAVVKNGTGRATMLNDILGVLALVIVLLIAVAVYLSPAVMPYYGGSNE